MSQGEVAIIEFGSKKITVMIARRGINNTFDVKGAANVEYAGFYDGDWLEPEQLKIDIGKAISQAESIARVKIRDMFVGVPGEFTTAISKDVSTSYKGRQKISEQEVYELFEIGDTFKYDPEYIVINRSPVYYTLDDNRMIIDPIGMQTSKMSGKLSYVLAERRFLKKISLILSEYDFRAVEYVSSVLAEGLFLFEPDTRDRFVLFCDIGYITTNVVLMRGDGILYMKSFSLGGGHIEADLAECLHIGFDEARKLKKSIALSLNVDENDVYEVETEEGKLTFPARTVHDIVEARIEDIGDMILKCLDGCAQKYPDYIALQLTGGGVSYLRGGKEVLSRYIKRSVEIANVALPHIVKPHEVAEYGMLDIALKNVQTKKESWFKKILG